MAIESLTRQGWAAWFVFAAPPLFGLPLAIKTWRRPSRIKRAFYLVFVLSLITFASVAAGLTIGARLYPGKFISNEAIICAGAVAGFLGSSLAFLLGRGLGVLAAGAATLPRIAWQAVVLTAVGYLAGLSATAQNQFVSFFLSGTIGFGWQLAFAWFLSSMLVTMRVR